MKFFALFIIWRKKISVQYSIGTLNYEEKSRLTCITARTHLGPDRLELIIFHITNKKICNLPCRL